MNRKGLAVGIIVLFIVSSILPMSIGSHVNRVENYKYVPEVQYQQYMNDWHVQQDCFYNANESDCSVSSNENSSCGLPIKFIVCSTGGPMDSAWPMQSHDVHHTGLSSYSTANNSGVEIWHVHGESAGSVESSAVIDNAGIIYFGTLGSDSSLYALYPNGTRFWSYKATALIWSTPALAEDGSIYFGTWGSYPYFHALNPDGTLKWLFATGPSNSPTIADDGTIYVGGDNSIVWALNPNGTLKWSYDTDDIVMGCPAIGADGTIYIGSGDHYLYALYPNGTLRWRFNTGSYIKGSASLADDGTIYVPSFNSYFYALYPNGTLKWKAYTGDSTAAAGVALAEDGTIYVGTELLRAFYPNGTLKWSTNLQGSIYGTVPALSADGTVYVSAGPSLVAVNPDGTEKWRKTLSNEQVCSSPSIGEDGRVYVGSTYSDYGYLHAFGLGPLRAEADGPYSGAMTQPLQFNGEAFGGISPYTYYWEFGDGNTSEDQNPTHTYAHRGNYTAALTVTDTTGNHSSDTAQVEIGYPLPKITIIKPINALYIANVKICKLPSPIVIGRITIITEVTQVDASIDRVEFYYDGILKYTDRSPPYQWVWKGHPPPFSQNLMVRAIDTRGNQQDQMIYITKLF